MRCLAFLIASLIRVRTILGLLVCRRGPLYIYTSRHPAPTGSFNMSPENLQLQNASSEPPPIPPRLDTLPRELVLRIATFLIPETPASGSERPWLPTDVLHLSSTCRSLEFLASDGLLWKAIFKHTFAAPLGDGVSAMSFATLYKLRTMMARESIKILVPFNHTSADTLDDVSLVLARVWTEFLAADDGRNARFLASWNKIVEGLREAVGAVLGKVEARRGSTAVTGAETGNDTWKLLHLLACICIQCASTVACHIAM